MKLSKVLGTFTKDSTGLADLNKSQESVILNSETYQIPSILGVKKKNRADVIEFRNQIRLNPAPPRSPHPQSKSSSSSSS